MQYKIQKRTPAVRNFYTIHQNLDLGLAKFILADIGATYDSVPDKEKDSYLTDDGMYLYAYHGGDRHEFRIVEWSA